MIYREARLRELIADMIQAEKLEQVLERKGYRVTKPESGDNLDSIDVLRSDHLKGATPSEEISACF